MYRPIDTTPLYYSCTYLCRYDHVSEGSCIERSLRNVAESLEVLQTLGHLLVIDVNEAIVYPARTHRLTYHVLHTEDNVNMIT